MDKKTLGKFSTLEKVILYKIAGVNKRIDDQKSYLNTIFSILGTMLAGFVVIFVAILGINYVNVKSEMEELRIWKNDTKNEIDEELGRVSKSAKMTALTASNELLANHEVKAGYYTKVDNETKKVKRRLHWKYILKNAGDGPGKHLFIVYYTKNPLKLVSLSADESDFDYQDILSEDSLRWSNYYPSGFSSYYSVRITLHTDNEIKAGRYPALMKIYSEDEETEVISFYIRIDEDIPSVVQ